jgi:serine phosphatase RsbU (regulator of sigma subunit)
MEKAGTKELQFLETLNKADQHDRHHIVRMFHHFYHRSLQTSYIVFAGSELSFYVYPETIFVLSLRP